MEERSPAAVLWSAQDKGIEIVDFRFRDLPGLMQHFSEEIQESDMILLRRDGPSQPGSTVDRAHALRTAAAGAGLRQDEQGQGAFDGLLYVVADSPSQATNDIRRGGRGPTAAWAGSSTSARR